MLQSYLNNFDNKTFSNQIILQVQKLLKKKKTKRLLKLYIFINQLQKAILRKSLYCVYFLNTRLFNFLLLLKKNNVIYTFRCIPIPVSNSIFFKQLVIIYLNTTILFRIRLISYPSRNILFSYKQLSYLQI